MKRILFLLILFFFISNVYAISFSDHFTGYDSQYLILSDTNYTSGWSLANDANTSSTVIGNISSYAQFIPIDVSKAGGNTGGISRVLDRNFDLTDWNTSGSRLYTFVKMDDNANFIRAEIRLGNNSGNYFEYRNSSPFNQGWINGWQLVEFDLNSPSVVTGSPSLVNTSFLQMNATYQAGQADFNVTFNQVWLELPPNSFNNQYHILDVSGQPDGWAHPFNLPNQGRGVTLTNTNDPSLGGHGRLMITSLDNLDSSVYDFDFSIDLNQVDTNWGTRLLIDAANFSPGDNFSSCYLFDATSTSRRIGVEQWVNGVRTFTQSTKTMNYNDYNTMRCLVQDNNIAVFMDGVIQASQTITRVRGNTGIESFGGRTMIKNVSLDATFSTTGTIPFGQGGLNLGLVDFFLGVGVLFVIAGLVFTSGLDLSVIIITIIMAVVVSAILHSIFI